MTRRRWMRLQWALFGWLSGTSLCALLCDEPPSQEQCATAIVAGAACLLIMWSRGAR